MAPRSNVIGGLIAAVVLASPIVYFMLAGRPQAQRAGDGALSLAAPLPADVPPGVTLTIGDPLTQKVLQYNGWDRALPFHINWVHIAGGPAVTEAFHARALDIGAAADIPPIHAVWVGIPVKIIAIAQRRDPLNNPVWVMAVGPKSGVQTLADLRGKRIAFSPGQVQGEVVLRTLRERGLKRSDVTLVEMPSTGADVYINALIELLYQELIRPEYAARFRWRPNSLVVWDNQAVAHAGPIDYAQFDARRVVRRITVAGELPAGPDGFRSRPLEGELFNVLG